MGAALLIVRLLANSPARTLASRSALVWHLSRRGRVLSHLLQLTGEAGERRAFSSYRALHALIKIYNTLWLSANDVLFGAVAAAALFAYSKPAALLLNRLLFVPAAPARPR